MLVLPQDHTCQQAPLHVSKDLADNFSLHWPTVVLRHFLPICSGLTEEGGLIVSSVLPGKILAHATVAPFCTCCKKPPQSTYGLLHVLLGTRAAWASAHWHCRRAHTNVEEDGCQA